MADTEVVLRSCMVVARTSGQMSFTDLKVGFRNTNFQTSQPVSQCCTAYSGLSYNQRHHLWVALIELLAYAVVYQPSMQVGGSGKMDNQIRHIPVRCRSAVPLYVRRLGLRSEYLAYSWKSPLGLAPHQSMMSSIHCLCGRRITLHYITYWSYLNWHNVQRCLTTMYKTETVATGNSLEGNEQ